MVRGLIVSAVKVHERLTGLVHGDPPPLDLDGMDPLSASVFVALMRMVRLQGLLLHRIAAGEGGHPGQSMCLRILAAHDGLSQRDLADTLHLSAPTVSAMLRRMERGGVIARQADAEDQRITRVFLTDEGRRREREFKVALGRHLREILAPMSEEDRREAARLFQAIADNTARALA